MSDKPTHPHIYIQTLTVRLFVFVTAPWWLLFSPSWGDDDGVLREAGREVCSEGVVQSLLRRSSFKSGKRSATQNEVNLRCCYQSTAGMRILKYSHWFYSPSLIRRVHHLESGKKRGGKVMQCYSAAQTKSVPLNCSLSSKYTYLFNKDGLMMRK